MNIPDELLAAYLDGELNAAERARVEQAIAQDKRIAQRVAKERASRARSRGALDAEHQAPMPQRLAHIGRSVAGHSTAQVIDLARVRAERKRRSERTRTAFSRRIGLAAGLAGGVLLGVLAARLSPSSALTEYQGGALLARGALADALNEQLATSPSSSNAVRVGLSFKSRTGSYCRTFSVHDSQPLAGLACREQNHWRVWTLDATAPRGTTVRVSRGAAGLPPALAQAVSERISGAPLDSQAELSARRSGWR